MRTRTLRRQHDGAMAIVSEIQATTRRFAATSDRALALAITIGLARLTGLLRIHFAQEDGLLYPALMASGDREVARTARGFVDEMGRIGPAYADFAERWSLADAILANGPRFMADADGIFAALGDRIRRENEILYPLADAAAEMSAGGTLAAA